MTAKNSRFALLYKTVSGIYVWGVIKQIWTAFPRFIAKLYKLLVIPGGYYFSSAKRLGKIVRSGNHLELV